MSFAEFIEKILIQAKYFFRRKKERERHIN